MSWFNKKKNNDPFPKGLVLMDKSKDPREIKLSRLTEEILKEDIGFIRDFYEKLCRVLNEKLPLLEVVGRNQQEIGVRINRFAGVQEKLTEMNVEMLNEVKQSVASNGTKHNQIIETLLKMIESLNQVVELQNRMISALGNTDAKLVDLPRLKPVEPASTILPNGKIQAAEKNQTPSTGSQDPGKRRPSNILSSADSGIAVEPDDVSQTIGNYDAQSGSEAGSSQSGVEIDQDVFSRQLLEEIKQIILNIYGKNAPIVVRNVDSIPGIQSGNIWLLALPPKSNGTYDNTVLQDSAFKKIRTCIAKNKEEKVIAVYKGEISEKRLAGANNAANEYKINLTHLSGIPRILGILANVK